MIDPKTPVWQLTVGEFMELMENATPANRIEIPSPENDEFLNSNQAVELLGISLSTLHRWKKCGYIEPVKVGGILKYSKLALKSILTPKK